MPFEAMEDLMATEEQVRKMRADAAAAAKQSIADARASGEKSVLDAARRAEDEIAQLRRKSEDDAKAKARDMADSNENRKAVMLNRAQANADKAAQFIVERIVNG